MCANELRIPRASYCLENTMSLNFKYKIFIFEPMMFSISSLRMSCDLFHTFDDVSWCRTSHDLLRSRIAFVVRHLRSRIHFPYFISIHLTIAYANRVPASPELNLLVQNTLKDHIRSRRDLRVVEYCYQAPRYNKCTS